MQTMRRGKGKSRGRRNVGARVGKPQGVEGGKGELTGGSGMGFGRDGWERWMREIEKERQE